MSIIKFRARINNGNNNRHNMPTKYCIIPSRQKGLKNKMLKLQTQGDIIMSIGDDASFTFTLTSGEITSLTRHVFKANQGESLYFLILNPNVKTNGRTDTVLVYKEYKDNGDVVTQYINQSSTTTYNNTNIDEDGNVIIQLEAADTNWLTESPYKYQVKAKINTYEPLTSKPSDWDTDCTKYYYWNSSTGLYTSVAAGTTWSTEVTYYNKKVSTNTVTNRHNLWLIDDDYNRNWN